MIRRSALLLLFMCAASPAIAQHEQHTGAMPDDIGSGSVKFATSCAPAVANDFNRAVAMLHSFWFPEAIREFEGVLQRDPSCAVALWGTALSQWGNPFAGQRGAAAIERGQATVTKARTTGTPTPRERALIDAVAILFSSTDAGTQAARIRSYEDAMQAIATAHPTDTEVRIFYALAVSQAAVPTDKTYGKQLKAAAMLEPLFASMPQHPGLAHYIIHAYDAPPLAPKALTAARRYASLAPAVPHALHMPSHTFTRVGSWRESVETNRRSAEAARKAGGAGEELHALDYQTYAYLQMADDAEAKEVVEHAASMGTPATAPGASGQLTPGAQAGGANSFALAAIPARYALERGDWQAAAGLQVRSAPTTPYTEAMTHFARAVGSARSGQAAAATPDLERMSELVTRLKTMQDSYWAEQVDLQRRMAWSWQLFAQGDVDRALTELRAAADAEDLTDKAAVTPGPLVPARESLAEMLLAAGRQQEALAAFEQTMAKEPNRFRALYGAARVAELLGQQPKARALYAQLLEITKGSDSPRPELAAARAFVGR